MAKEMLEISEHELNDIIRYYLDEYEGISDDSIENITYIITDEENGFALDSVLVEHNS